MPRRASARRHAQAIFQIARATGELEKWREELMKVAQAVADHALLAEAGESIWARRSSPRTRSRVTPRCCARC